MFGSIKNNNSMHEYFQKPSTFKHYINFYEIFLSIWFAYDEIIYNKIHKTLMYWVNSGLYQIELDNNHSVYHKV